MRCEDLEVYFMDYLEGSLNKEIKEEFEKHLDKCEACKKEFLELREVHEHIEAEVKNIVVKGSFTSSLKEESLKNGTNRKKIRLKTILVAAVLICISIITVIAAENGVFKFREKFINENSSEAYLNNGVGNLINISKVDNNVKVTIDSVVADDLHTLVFYTIENLKDDRKINFKLHEGITLIENTKEYSTSSLDYTWTVSDYNLGDEENKKKGKLVLKPLDINEENIKLNITKLEAANSNTDLNDKEDIIGNWSFEFLVKKYPSKEYAMNEEINIENIPITFTKIILAPTRTVLEYECGDDSQGKEFESIGVSIVDKKTKKEYDGLLIGDVVDYLAVGSGGGNKRYAAFDTIYFNDVKDIYIKINNYIKVYSNPKEYLIDLDKPFPQEIEYMGSKIILDNLKIEEKTKDEELVKFTIEEKLENREYERLNFHVIGLPFAGSGRSYEAIFIDEDNNKYDFYDGLGSWNEIKGKKPKLYSTTSKMEVTRLKNSTEIKDRNKMKLILDNYTKTYFCDEKVKIRLK